MQGPKIAFRVCRERAVVETDACRLRPLQRKNMSWLPCSPLKLDFLRVIAKSVSEDFVHIAGLVNPPVLLCSTTKKREQAVAVEMVVVDGSGVGSLHTRGFHHCIID